MTAPAAAVAASGVAAVCVFPLQSRAVYVRQTWIAALLSAASCVEAVYVLELPSGQLAVDLYVGQAWPIGTLLSSGQVLVRGPVPPLFPPVVVPVDVGQATAGTTLAAAASAALCVEAVWVFPQPSVAQYVRQTWFAAWAFAALCVEAVYVLELPSGQLAVAVYVGHRQALALRSASACEAVEVNVRVSLPHVLVDRQVFGADGGDVGATEHRQARALRSASACETADVNVRVSPPQVLVAVHLCCGRGGGGGPGSTRQLRGSATAGRAAARPDNRPMWDRMSARSRPIDEPRQSVTSWAARAATAAGEGTGFSVVAKAFRATRSTWSSVAAGR